MSMSSIRAIASVRREDELSAGIEAVDVSRLDVQGEVLADGQLVHAWELCDQRQVVLRNVHVRCRAADFGEIDTAGDRCLSFRPTHRELMRPDAKNDIA